MITKPWVSVEVVAHHWDLSKDTIYRWWELRRPRAHHVLCLWKFKLSEEDDWVRAGSAHEASNQKSGGAS